MGIKVEASERKVTTRSCAGGNDMVVEIVQENDSNTHCSIKVNGFYLTMVMVCPTDTFLTTYEDAAKYIGSHIHRFPVDKGE